MLFFKQKKIFIDYNLIYTDYNLIFFSVNSVLTIQSAASYSVAAESSIEWMYHNLLNQPSIYWTG